METKVNTPSRQIVVIEEDGTNIGTMPIKEGYALAEERELDLVCVDPNANLPVYKIMDKGKWEYSAKKKMKKQHHQIQETKEMRFRLKTDEHDIDTKVRKIGEFLQRGDKVKLVVMMKGREKSFQDLAEQKLNHILSKLPMHSTISGVQRLPSQVLTTIKPCK